MKSMTTLGFILSLFLVALPTQAAPAGTSPSQTQATASEGIGVVDEVDAAKGIVTISHEPIKSLNWPAMTMDFVVKDKKILAKLSKGKKIHFSFIEQHGDYVVTKVK